MPSIASTAAIRQVLLLYLTFLVRERGYIEASQRSCCSLSPPSGEAILFGPYLGCQWHELAEEVMRDPSYGSYNANFLNLFRMSKPAFASLVSADCCNPRVFWPLPGH